MTPYDLLASLWRTVVPLIVGTVAAWLAHAGIGVDSAAATAWLTAAFTGAYYTLFRLLEAHVSPAWGWLLGLARPPQYAQPTRPVPVAPPAPTPPASA